MRLKPYYVYMLMCHGERVYIGITTDPDRRVAEHNAGSKTARFTRAHRPVRLLATQQVADRSTALKLEAALKRLPRLQKLEWAAAHRSC